MSNFVLTTETNQLSLKGKSLPKYFFFIGFSIYTGQLFAFKNSIILLSNNIWHLAFHFRHVLFFCGLDISQAFVATHRQQRQPAI